MNRHLNIIARSTIGGVALIASVVATPSDARAQWSTTYEQFYLPGSFNWQFRHRYPAADRLFNAFDYGHAILYERLWTAPGAPVSILEEKEYNFLTREVLVHPPRVPLEEAAIEIAYAKLAPEAKQMFDWAHLLHRQIYDVWADERIAVADKDARVQELVRYYKTRPELAFSSQPKTMELMEGQPYSTSFRKNYPKFNGLIWAYHWLQIGLYEPLLAGKNLDERQTGIIAAVARFKQMIEDPPTSMPRVMPMSPAVAPLFTARYPEAAIIFDNLHSMHDVVSDILSNPSVPRNRKRAEILLAASRYRDDSSFVQTPQQWREMSMMMGIENMGGPVRGFLAAFPQATVERGAVMAAMDHSKMNMAATPVTPNAAPMPGMPGHNMAAPAKKDSAASPMSAMDHAKMAPGADSQSRGGTPESAGHSPAMMELHSRMMADPVIRQRIMADTAMRRMMESMTGAMPMADHAAHEAAPAVKPKATAPASKAKSTAKPAVRKPATTKAKPPAAKPAPAATKKAPAKKPDPMKGMDHGKMKMP